MTTTLITADLHLTDNPRDKYRHDFMQVILDALKEHECDHLLILGDLTNEKDRHNGWLVNRIVTYLNQFSQTVRGKVYVLRGNHDSPTAENPFFQFVDCVGKGDITWINEPTVRRGGTWLFLPHTRNHQRDWPKDLKGYDFIFTHQCYQGALGYNDHKLDGVPLDVFPKDAQVISGDIHAPQTLGGAHEAQVTYVGAPYTINFGDSYVPRMLLLRNGRLTSILCPGPQKRLVTMDRMHARGSLGCNKGDIVKVRAGIDSMHQWPDMRAHVHAWADKHELVLYSIQPMLSEPDVASIKISPRTHKSDEVLLGEYVKSRRIDERTAKTGAFLMGKAHDR